MNKSQKEKIDMINKLDYRQISYLQNMLSSISEEEIRKIIDSMNEEKKAEFFELIDAIRNNSLDGCIDRFVEEPNELEGKEQEVLKSL